MDLILSLLALIVLEIILGIDNLVFLSVLTERLPKQDRKKARRWGLTFAWVTRLLLLAFALSLMHMKKPVLFILDLHFSIRDLFLILGGVFLIYKSTQEIHHETLVLTDTEEKALLKKVSFIKVVMQIAIMDIIFSLDSVLTAVGLTSNFYIMALAISIAILVMIYASEPVSAFIATYPSVKMLALSFLMLIGVMLVADGLSFHMPRGYLYFAMSFSLSVEGLNLFVANRKKRQR